ncbi:MAG: transglycosylase SLT domain-containing protein [Pseudomonadota bacterium]|nr:transglycosylase SLT domain-containing protein [Pseudomonadota bacterium]
MKKIILSILSFLWFAAAGASPVDTTVLKQALDEARNGDFLLVNSLKSKLKRNELWPYFEYHQLRTQLPNVPAGEVQSYLLRNATNPLSDWMRSTALKAYGQSEQWKNILYLQKQPPEDIELRCFYYRALMEINVNAAKAGAEEVWLSGKSRPKTCDPLFAWAKESGVITDEMIWQRILLVLEAGNTGLSRFLQRGLSDEWALPAQALDTLLNDPKSIIVAQDALKMSTLVDHKAFGYSSSLYVAKKDVSTAVRLLPELSHRNRYNLDQQAQINRQIVRKVNGMTNPVLERQIRPLVIQVGEMKLISPTLRDAIEASKWDDVLFWLGKIKDEPADDSYINYWRGRAYEAKGYKNQAKLLFETAAKSRNFYGFMAAERLGQPYSFNDVKVESSEETARLIKAQPAIQRIHLLKAMGEDSLAISEMHYLVQQNQLPAEQMAQYFLDHGWPELAVQTTIKAKLWNNLGQRFPVAYFDLFDEWAYERKVDPYLLMSIARRESAFNPSAESSAGAKGLMQVMPATGQTIVRELEDEENIVYSGSQDLFDPNISVQLGSHYVATLLDKYGQNRIAMLSGYNAGPHRIEKWLDRRGSLDVDQFIESIPFYETRAYVKAVLTYRAIFEYLKRGEVDWQKKPIKLLSEEERSFSYNRLP